MREPLLVSVGYAESTLVFVAPDAVDGWERSPRSEPVFVGEGDRMLRRTPLIS